MSARAKTESEAPEETRREESEPAPRLVYTQAPVLLGRLLERLDGGRWRVDLGAVERALPVDEAVDPALLDEAAAQGARVLVDGSAPSIVGVVATRRGLTIDREGRLRERLRSVELEASEQVLFKVPGAFVRAKAREVEVYGDRVLTRARDLAKVLAAMIKLN
ncbi:MAG TPA: hypothetical protein RMH99_29310 [Sandaracinaceae bacterium LLY-WYZ-13_1]|nr:hypothetical protein [Sandaracinaceae bacterium LLY-WYZ-13_1]